MKRGLGAGLSSARRARLLGAGALGLLVAVVVAGCAPEHGPSYLSAFAAGERAFHAGRWGEAAAAWDGAAAQARGARDRDEARFLAARAFERAERWPEARAEYGRLVAESPEGERSGRAVFDLAGIEIAHGDAAKGWAMLDDAVRRLPEHGVARPAFRRLLQHAEDTGGEAAVLAFLDAHEAALRETDLDQVVGYERARSLERAGRRKEAHDAYLATARRHPYPKGGLTDDAFWHAAVIDDEDRRFEEAIAHLREMLAARESAGLWASYERPRYSEAQLRIAEIYRDGLHDHAAARRELEVLYTRFPTTTRRDDAVWAEARLAVQDGDQATACALAKRIVEELPESRYVACVAQVCPGAAPGKRACADYILRELAADRQGAQAAPAAPAEEAAPPAP